MFTPRRLSVSCFLVLCLVTTVLAQAEQPGNIGQKPSQTTTTVTASATAERVRFTAPGNVVRMQLQVFSESGQILFDVSSRGNVLDLSLQDSSGQRLQGSYLTVVTVKTLSGKLSRKLGTLLVQEKQLAVQPISSAQLTPEQSQALSQPLAAGEQAQSAGTLEDATA